MGLGHRREVGTRGGLQLALGLSYVAVGEVNVGNNILIADGKGKSVLRVVGNYQAVFIREAVDNKFICSVVVAMEVKFVAGQVAGLEFNFCRGSVY